MGINVSYAGAGFITNEMKIPLTKKSEGEFIFLNLSKSN